MRVVLGLLLCACLGLVSAQPEILNPDSANTFHIVTGTNPSGWKITGLTTPTGLNPTLNVTVGKTYYISIEVDTTSNNHPFVLSAATPVDTLLVNNGSCQVGGTPPGYWTTGTAPYCVLAFTPNQTTPQPLSYKCTVHSGMVGQIQLNAAPAATTAPPTTAAPVANATTAPPTTAAPVGNATTSPPTNATTPTTATPTTAPTTISADSSNTFYVTNAAGTDHYVFTSGTTPYNDPTLTMEYGKTYKISIEFNSANHPFGLSTSATGTAVQERGLVNVNSTCGGSATAGYTATTKCTLTFTPPANTPQPLYYHCAFHPNMVGQIVVTGLPKGSGFALVPGFAALFAVVLGLFASTQ